LVIYFYLKPNGYLNFLLFHIVLCCEILKTSIMKKVWFLTFALLTSSLNGFSQIDKILGKWKTIDDEEGIAMSIVNVYKGANGKYYGRIEKLLKL